jgi:hypothetical protein
MMRMPVPVRVMAGLGMGLGLGVGRGRVGVCMAGRGGNGTVAAARVLHPMEAALCVLLYCISLTLQILLQCTTRTPPHCSHWPLTRASIATGNDHCVAGVCVGTEFTCNLQCSSCDGNFGVKPTFFSRSFVAVFFF